MVKGEPFVVNGQQMVSIRQINNLPQHQKEAIYRTLIPPEALLRFGIPFSLTDPQGNSLWTCICERGTGSVTIALRHRWDAEDPVLYLELTETLHNQVEVLFFCINDPESERYNVDRMPDGRPTNFGLDGRNIPEEIRAMEAGLAPGQVRQGARLTRRLIPRFEDFVARLGYDRFQAQPLFYHAAILFERCGFAYTMGQGKMEWIHQEFQRNGVLHRRLDGSTPFRQPGMEATVRGRSWAIYDGILGEPFTGVRMYKRIGTFAGVCTFPDAVW
ncbi:MAG: hypothetical protein D6793_06105 [Thermoflexia bacterium]|nr:MAG: hypothetical protein D6793_06105 [Thermoflexia bacterium]